LTKPPLYVIIPIESEVIEVIYVVYRNGPFNRDLVVAYTTEEMAQMHCDTMNATSHYKYYFEEIAILGVDNNPLM
jgi:hypothetical protein